MKKLTVEKLYEVCKELMEDGHREYEVALGTGGYYDDIACEDILINHSRDTIYISTMI